MCKWCVQGPANTTPTPSSGFKKTQNGIHFWCQLAQAVPEKRPLYFVHTHVACSVNLLDTVHRHRSSRATSCKCNMNAFVANFLTMEMCHSLARFLHTWHVHKANTCVVWKHLHSDIQYLYATTVRHSEQMKQKPDKGTNELNRSQHYHHCTSKADNNN